MAFAKKLRDGGASFRVIRYVTKNVDPFLFGERRADWLIVEVIGERIRHTVADEKDLEIQFLDMWATDAKSVFVIVRLRELTHAVQKRINRFVEEQLKGRT